MSNNHLKKFTTGLIVLCFNSLEQNIYTLISDAKSKENINEVLVIVPPQLSDDLNGWKKRIQTAEQSKYFNFDKQYDVWHGEPIPNETSMEYFLRISNQLKQQYPHQDQVVIYNSLLS